LETRGRLSTGAERALWHDAVPLENAWLTGTGVRKPIGVFTSRENDIGTNWDCEITNLLGSSD
jgi:hypothetical protein